MKNVIIATLLLLASVAANATGMKRNILDCATNPADGKIALTLDRVTISSPGHIGKPYFLAQLTEEKRAGTADSGEVAVTPLVDADGVVRTYTNREEGFDLRILGTSGTISGGKPSNVRIKATFKDVSGRGLKGDIKDVWLVCKSPRVGF